MSRKESMVGGLRINPLRWPCATLHQAEGFGPRPAVQTAWGDRAAASLQSPPKCSLGFPVSDGLA